MIVKNETQVIRRLLASVLPFIDSYCICDTGSTDGTADLITSYFAEHGVPGQIVHEPFRDFGYNRTFALKAAASLPADLVPLADYLLLMDADMILTYPDDVDMAACKHRLREHDVWHLFQGTPSFFYKNVRLVRNRPGIAYWGVTHEYFQPIEGSTYGNFEFDELFIHDVGDGGSKSDKCERDIRLLTQGLVDHPDNDRYTFYLANTYRDKGDNELAVATYRRRIEIGGWVEEIWQSYFNIGRCYQRMGRDAEAIEAWMDGYHAHPARIENLYEIVQHYRKAGKNTLAHLFYDLADAARRKNTHWDYLFLQKDVYDFKLDYEFTIVGYYCNPGKRDLAGTCMHVLATSKDCGMMRNVLSNYKFYTPRLETLAAVAALSPANAALLAGCGSDALPPLVAESEGLVASTPSLCALTPDAAAFAVCVRYVNYRVDDQGNYVNQDKIVTKNVISIVDTSSPDNVWRKVDEFVLHYNTALDDRYVGLEDIRLYVSSTTESPRLHYNANRAIPEYVGAMTAQGETMYMQIEHGDIVAQNRTTVHAGCLTYEHARPLEKNWLMFSGGSGGSSICGRCVYGWSPLVIGEIREGHAFVETHRSTDVPSFFTFLRGSSNGVDLLGADGRTETWFLCHVVSYEDRRFYYHLWVVLDTETLAVKKYTRLWTFHAEAKVEYTLGFMPIGKRNGDSSSDAFLVGYSVNDCQTRYMAVNREDVEAMMIRHES
jgi:glycosyltransferase involved in cell wall biosynthesis